MGQGPTYAEQAGSPRLPKRNEDGGARLPLKLVLDKHQLFMVY